MPELQRMAQSLGIPGAGRMRKGQLVEAIEARQGGAPKPEAGAANQSSDQRAASAGADAARLRKQDTMGPDTRTQPGIGDGAALHEDVLRDLDRARLIAGGIAGETDPRRIDFG